MNTLYKFPAAPCLSLLEIATRFERTHIFLEKFSMEQLKVKWVYKRKYPESKYIDFFCFVLILFYFIFTSKKKDSD